jgi:hypothetical protein
MPKPFDAVLKDLIEAFPADWLRLLGVPLAGPVEVLSPELSTVTAAADTLLKVGGGVVHIDVESGPDDRLAGRLLLYNVLAHRHTGLPVHSVAVLLRANAKAANLTGELGYAPHPGGEVRFRFEVVRVWERAAEDLLAAGVELMPLAVLGKPPAGQTREQAIPGLVVRVADAARRAAPDRSARVVAAALILAGMHADRDALYTVIRRLQTMDEKNAAIEIFEEWGAIKALKRAILEQGREKVGDPSPKQEQAIRGIEDLDRLDRMVIRVLKARGWSDLLKTR